MPPPHDTSFDVGEAFTEYGGALFAFAVNALSDRGEAQDCVQEVFIRAWRSRDRYDGSRGSVQTWLFAIMRNIVIDALRARGRRPVPSDRTRIDWASDPVTEDLVIVERLDLYEALAALTFEHRQVIVAVQLEGLKYSELSEQIGVSVATLRTRMYYGLKALCMGTGGRAHDEGHSLAQGGAHRRGASG